MMKQPLGGCSIFDMKYNKYAGAILRLGPALPLHERPTCE